jgi:hypothetical protein
MPHTASTLTVMTWNLQGSQRPDITKVADKIKQFQPDIIAIQELQNHQARWFGGRSGDVRPIRPSVTVPVMNFSEIRCRRAAYFPVL